MNLTDGQAYMKKMRAAAAASRITLQYCMIHGRHYLQGSLYPNLMSVRTSQDRFNPNRWTEFLYGSRMAQAMGIWPWSDVYMSTKTRNLLISGLSAGLLGVGNRRVQTRIVRSFAARQTVIFCSPPTFEESST